MTPEKRLDQLEPLVADVLQKVDRLIEGQGQLVELTTSTHELALSTHELAIGTHKLSINTHELATGTHELAINTRDSLQQVKTTGEITANGLVKLTIVVNDLRDEMQEGFNEVRVRFDKNEQTQQAILTLLQKRLK